MKSQNPDARFPRSWRDPVSFHGESFRNRRRWGRERMADSRAVFCLLTRDVEKSLPDTITWIGKRASAFKDYRVIAIENDSKDGTANVLSRWAENDRRVLIDSQQLGLPRWPQVVSLDRARQLAGLRNRYLDLLGELEFSADYTVVLDGDIPRGVSPEGFKSSFGYEDWDVMTSNGISGIDDAGGGTPEFFDAWAFREHGAAERRSFKQINRLLFRPGMPPRPVWSAFGGLAIYRRECLEGMRYGGEDCEHVSLHTAMRKAGHNRIYLNPSQVVLY